MDSFKTFYTGTVLPDLQKALGLKNSHAVPMLRAVKLNVGVGTFLRNNKDLSPIIENVSLIAGQKPVITKSRKAISNFKLREQQPNGVTVTLRGQRMLDFLNRLTNVVLPRVRDFRGISTKSFDGHGNYSLGISEHTVFPEARLDDSVKSFGIQVTIVTTARNNKEGEALLTALGFPFRETKTDN